MEDDAAPNFLDVDAGATSSEELEAAGSPGEAVDRETATADPPSPELTTTTPARRSLALPWLLAAVLFAAAALVMAYMIWLRPRP